MYFLPPLRIFERFVHAKQVPRVVSESPKPLNAEDVRQGLKWGFQKVDDQILVLDRTEWLFSSFGDPMLGLLVASGMFGLSGLALWAMKGVWEEGVLFGLIWIAFFVFAGSAGLFFGRHALRALVFSTFLRPATQTVIFDRQAGTVTLPPVSWGEPETIEFTDLKVGYAGSGSGGPHLVAFRETGDGAVDLTLGHGVGKDWSFYVWYMDKNRPLPPGTAFDPYRERDEARRRGLGARRFAHAADGIGNVLPLEGPIPEEVDQFLPHFEEVFGRFNQIEWVAFGGLVHHQTEHVDGLHLEVKTSNDVPLPNDISAELNQSLMATLLSRLPHYRFLELAFTPRPRGRAIYSKSTADFRDAAEMG